MAHEYTTWAYKQPITPTGAKFILVALADTADANGYSFPGQKRLAAMTGQTDRTVRKHLAMLEEHGYVKREERRRKDGTRTSDGYHLPQKDATGNIFRWASTGRKQQTNRKVFPSSPEESSGHEPPVEPSVEELQTSPSGDELATTRPQAKAKSEVQQVVDAYNAHCGSLPTVRALNTWRTRKIKNLIRDLGSTKEAIAVMGIAASEVANDDFWQQRRYGLDNLLRESRAIQKAETAVSRGTTDRNQADEDRLLAALGGL